MAAVDSVSILVVSWNGLEHLRACFESLAALRPCGATVEILLLDNGSTDHSVERVRRDFPAVRVVASEKNLGFAEANNRLATLAQGDALALLNNDTRVEPDWLAALVDALRAAPGDVAAVAGRIVDWRGERLDFGRGVMTFDGHAFALDQGRPLASARLPADGEETLFGCGGNLLVRRSSFVEAGGFDGRYFAYFEDVDLGWRLWAGGERVLHASGAVVRHRLSATSSRLGNRRRGAMFERNAMWTVLKNLDEEMRPLLLPAVLTTYLSRIGALIASDGAAAAGPPRAGRVRRLRERWRARAAATEPPLSLRSDPALAQLEALGAILAGLDGVERERARLSGRRRRGDREIFERFPPWIVPTYAGDAELFGSPFFAGLLPRGMRFERASLAETIAGVEPEGAALEDGPR